MNDTTDTDRITFTLNLPLFLGLFSMVSNGLIEAMDSQDGPDPTDTSGVGTGDPVLL
jgi:hypothetical protein